MPHTHVTHVRNLVRSVFTDRCVVCKSLDCVEDEQHFVFDCPAYSHIRSQHSTSCSTVADFITFMNQMHVVVYLGNALHVGSKSCLYEFTELKFLSVGCQLPPRTLNILMEQCVHMSPCRPD